MYESGQYRPPAGHDDNNDFFDDDESPAADADPRLGRLDRRVW